VDGDRSCGASKNSGMVLDAPGLGEQEGRKLVTGGVMVGYGSAGAVDGHYKPATTGSSH
jgi:hypothetical protein